jgi:hypothetical protein
MELLWKIIADERGVYDTMRVNLAIQEKYCIEIQLWKYILIIDGSD